MKPLLNTLYIMTPDTYLSLENENVCVNLEEKILGKFPLHSLEQIVYFGYKGASPALLGECAKRGIGLSFHKGSGRFMARVVGITAGNVLLRKAQYRISDDEEKKLFYCQVLHYRQDLQQPQYHSKIQTRSSAQCKCR